MASCQVAERGLVGNPDNRPLSTGLQKLLDSLGHRPRDDAKIGVALLDALDVVGADASARVPDGAEIARASDRPFGGSSHPDLRPRSWQRPESRVVEGPVLAVERALPGPQRTHQPQCLVRAAVTAAELVTHEAELVLVPTDADAEPKASTRELLKRRRLLREVDRVVQRQEDDRRPEPDSLRKAGDPAERDQRVVDTSVGVDAIGPDDDVLGRPDGIEPELLAELGEAPDFLGMGVGAVVRQDDAEMHDEIVMRQRVAEARIARLATIDADGRPHLVPVVFALDVDTLYSAVDAKPKRSRRLQRIENARRRPDVTLLVDHYEEDWARLWWVRLRGRARVLDRGEEAARAVALLREKYEQYRAEPPGTPVLAVDIDEWRAWSAD